MIISTQYNLSMAWRTCAISALVAQQAGEREDVKEFRREALSDKLIAGGDVSKWVTNLRDKEPVLRKVSFFVDRETSKNVMEAQLAANRNRQKLSLDVLSNAQTHGVMYEKLLLPYADESDKDARYIEISPAGTLGRLKKLAENLSGCYYWTEAESVIFVLTGNPPLLEMKIEIAKWSAFPRGLTPFINLSIPQWYTASDVADAFSRTKQSFKRKYRKIFSTKTARAIKEKHARLIMFVCDNPGHKWNDLCCSWNKHPIVKKNGWAYDNGQDMGTAFNRAKKSLMELM